MTSDTAPAGIRFDALTEALPDVSLTAVIASEVRIRLTVRRRGTDLLTSDHTWRDAAGLGTAAWLRQVAENVAACTPTDLGPVRPMLVGISEPADSRREKGSNVSGAYDGARAAADCYAIGIPPGWIEHPLDPVAFDRSVRDLQRELASNRVRRADARRLELMQRQMQQQLLADNVQYIATLAGSAPSIDDVGEAQPSVLLAAVVVTSKTRSELGSPVPITPGLLVRGLGGSSTSTDTGVELEPPAEVQLSAGSAVRLVRYHSHGVPAGDRRERVEFYERTHLVPHDGGERLCIVQMVTPSIEYTEPLAQLFDAIAGTLRIFYPGKPTTFDVSVATVADASAP